MARPRTIKMGDGEIILKNLPKEEAERITALLTQKEIQKQAQEVIQEMIEEDSIDLSTPDQLPVNLPLDRVSLGIFQDKQGNWNIATVAFNEESKQAIVQSVKNYNKEKAIAMGDFKVIAARKMMVG